MAGVLFHNPLARQLSIAGAILPGWTATFCISGTSTPTDVYTDGDLTVPHENPVEAEADGHMPPIYLDPDVTYRVLIKDASGVLVPDGDVDPIDVSRGAGGGGGSAPPMAWGRVSDSGTLQSGSSGIASVTKDGAGNYIVTFDDGLFGAPPSCQATLDATDHSATIVFTANASATDVTVKTYDGTGLTPDDGAFHLFCVGDAP